MIELLLRISLQVAEQHPPAPVIGDPGLHGSGVPRRRCERGDFGLMGGMQFGIFVLMDDWMRVCPKSWVKFLLAGHFRLHCRPAGHSRIPHIALFQH